MNKIDKVKSLSKGMGMEEYNDYIYMHVDWEGNDRNWVWCSFQVDEKDLEFRVERYEDSVYVISTQNNINRTNQELWFEALEYCGYEMYEWDFVEIDHQGHLDRAVFHLNILGRKVCGLHFLSKDIDTDFLAEDWLKIFKTDMHESNIDFRFEWEQNKIKDLCIYDPQRLFTNLFGEYRDYAGYSLYVVEQ